MTPAQYVAFWAESHWGRAFGFYAPQDYTVAPHRHRGHDIRGGAPLEVPALREGRVFSASRSTNIGWFVVIQILDAFGRRIDEFDSYCHLFDGDTVRAGDIVAKGDRIGRLAMKNERPGSSWNGEHLHFVVSDTADAAWNTKRAVIDPRPIILAELATPAGGSGTPITPTKPKEWDEMATKEEIKQAQREVMIELLPAVQAGQGFNAFVIHGTGKIEDSADPRNGVWLFTNGKATQLAQGSVDFLNAWSTTDGKSVASNFDTFVTGGNPGAFDDLKRMFVLELVPADMDDPEISESVLTVLKTAIEEGIEALIPSIKQAARSGIEGATIRVAAT